MIWQFNWDSTRKSPRTTCHWLFYSFDPRKVRVPRVQSKIGALYKRIATTQRWQVIRCRGQKPLDPPDSAIHFNPIIIHRIHLIWILLCRARAAHFYALTKHLNFPGFSLDPNAKNWIVLWNFISLMPAA